VLFFSSGTAFPGAAALLPVLGAALVIHAGTTTQDTMAARLLSVRPMVFVGLVSYSLYLWHWPVLAFARMARGEMLAPSEAALLVAVSFVLAVLSWRFVEKPFRERRIVVKRVALFRAASAAMAAMLAIGVFANATDGWPQRHEDYAPPAIAGLERMNLATCFLKEDQPATAWAGADACRNGDASKPRIFLWGDSFAAHLVPGLADELGHRFQTVQYTAGGCPPLLGVDIANRPHCRAFNDRALDEIARLRPQIVLVSARWDLYVPRKFGPAEIKSTLDRIAATGARVVAVGMSPTFDFASPYDFVYRSGRHEARLNPAPSAFEGENSVAVFNPAPLFCERHVCRLTDGSDFLFFDGGHFSVAGSRRVARSLTPYLSQVTAGRPVSDPL
jgi:hypothetical protein